MMKTMYRKTRSSGNQPLPTGRFWGAHSQGLVSTSASRRSKSERRTVTQNYEHFQNGK
ncbi:hypothetical protein SAMN04487931_12514 [Desulfobacula phenolica]|uniref:Uncharacterized protein n=1 Tax=Desulfobacula phenolica TaxID=90732 RepID=A0A1H2K9G7_9BACT|nr:hypothetical protein SAMN04487931_12514 [Desulfobacula phenolica]